MRVFVAGASGVLGRHLLPLLVADGHAVAGMTRSADKAELLRTLGAEPVVCDAFDRLALCRAVALFAPDVVVHQLTDLPDDPARIAELAPANNRMRRVGTRNLVAAAQAAGSARVVAQSVAWPLPGDSGAAVQEHERTVLDAGGVIIRYGRFYGPGTYFEATLPAAPRVHVQRAARATVRALGAPGGVIVVVDDQPGPGDPEHQVDRPA